MNLFRALDSRRINMGPPKYTVHTKNATRNFPPEKCNQDFGPPSLYHHTSGYISLCSVFWVGVDEI